jgi:transcriptional regulator with XRE-family HTH domain
MKNIKCMPSPEHVGGNIRKIRLLRGYKQSQFAQQIGISPVTLSNIENGKVDMRLSILCTIASKLHIDIKILFIDQILS